MNQERIRQRVQEAAARRMSNAKAWLQAEEDYANDMMLIRLECPHPDVRCEAYQYGTVYRCPDCGMESADPPRVKEDFE